MRFVARFAGVGPLAAALCGAAALGVALGVALGAAAQEASSLTEDQALALERALVKLNFDPGEIDGVLDAQTRAAIRLYQEFAALPPDGMVSPDLFAEIVAVARSFGELRATRDQERAQERAAEAQEALEPLARKPEPDPAPEPAVIEPETVAPEPEPETAMAGPAAGTGIAPEPEPEPEPESPQASDAVPEAVPSESEPEPAAEPRAEQVPEQETAALPEAPLSGEPASEPPEETAVAEPAALRSDAAPEDAAPEDAAPEDAAPVIAESETVADEPPLEAPAETPAETPAEALAETPAEAQAETETPAPAETEAAAGERFDLKGLLSRLTTSQPAPREPAAVAETPEPSGDGEAEAARTPQDARTPGVDAYGAFKSAYAAAQAGEFEAAVRFYTEAIASQKLTLEHLAAAHFNRANALHYLGGYDKAIVDYDAAIDSRPGFAGAYYNRGFAYEASGEARRAVEDFRRARDLGLQRLGVRAPDVPPPLP